MPRYSILNLLLISSIIISCSKKQEPIKECLPIELQDGLIAFYPFSKGSLQDISGKKNHLTSNVGAIPAFDRDDNMNCSYFFDHLFFENDKSYLKLESPDFLNSLNSFSVSVWYKYDIDINGFGFLRSLVSRDTINEAGYDKIGQWSLALFDLARGVFSENANSWTNIVTPQSEWNHLVGVKSNNEILIYLNGELHEKSIHDPTIYDLGLRIAQDVGDLFIGYGFNGNIDDVMIFNKALSQKEVELIAKLSPCCE